jgi:hypothetical protein
MDESDKGELTKAAQAVIGSNPDRYLTEVAESDFDRREVPVHEGLVDLRVS